MRPSSDSTAADPRPLLRRRAGPSLDALGAFDRAPRSRVAALACVALLTTAPSAPAATPPPAAPISVRQDASGDWLPRWLDALGTPSFPELMERIGPPPSLDDALEPDREGELPWEDIQVPEEVIELGEAIDRAHGSHDLEFLEEAIPEWLAAVADRLPPEHSRLVTLAERLEVVEQLYELADGDREAVLEQYEAFTDALGQLQVGRFAEARTIFVDALDTLIDLQGDLDHHSLRMAGTLSVVLYRLGDPLGARTLGRLALASLYERVGLMNDSTAIALSNLGFFFIAERAFAEGEFCIAHSLAIRRRLQGTENDSYAVLLFNLGQLYRDSDRLALAARVFERCLEIRERHDTRAAVGTTHLQLGIVARSLGDLDEARRHLEQAFEFFEGELPDDHHERAQGLEALALVEMQSSRFEAAVEYGTRCVEMYARMYPRPRPEAAHSLQVLAFVHQSAGQLDRAEARIREALRQYEQCLPTSHIWNTEAQARLASILVAKGDWDLAHAVLVKNLPRRAQTWGERSQIVATDLADLAQAALHSGRTDEAIRCASEAESIVAEIFGGESRRVQIARMGLIEALLAADRLDEARGRLDAILASDAEAVLSPSRLGELHGLEARVLALEGRFDAALAAADRSSARLESVDPEHRLLAGSELLAGEALLDLGRADEALPRLERALDLVERLRDRVLGDERDRALYAGRLSMARAARTLVRAYTAAGLGEQALSAAERGRGRALLDLLARSSDELVARAAAREPGAFEGLEALLAAERDARASLLEAESTVRLARERGLDEGALADELALVRERRRTVRECGAAVSAALSSAFPSATAVGARDVLAALQPGQHLLHFTFGERAVVLVHAGDEREAHATLLAAGEDEVTELRGRVEALIADLAAGRPIDEGERDSLSRALVPAAVARELASARSVVLVPDGPLHGLPFEVLSLDGRDWLTDGPVTTATPSGSVLAGQTVARPTVASAAGRPRALLVGAPDFGGARADAEELEPGRSSERSTAAPAEGAGRARGASEAASASKSTSASEPALASEPASTSATAGGARSYAARLFDDRTGDVSELDRYRLFGGRLTPLPGSRVEVERVARELRSAGFDVEILLGADATEERLAERARGVEVLHLATHGFRADPARPFEAALALSAPRGENAADDGTLTLDELIRDWSGRLEGCELVTLSACDTNATARLGESLVSLYWGFFHAGARAALVSLWKVDDHATLLLMDRFYANWSGSFDEARTVRGIRFEPGERLPLASALAEARAWLATSPPEANRARLAELGALDDATSRGQGFPRPGRDPERRAARDPFDYRHPRYWSPFVLYGRGD